MQTGNDQETKVISITNRNQNQKASTPSNESAAENVADFTWEDVMKRNAENASRMKREREKSNKGVIRSYRLKH